MFEHSYETRYGDYKDFDRVSVSAILDIIQDAATRHSTECGYGMHRLYDMGLAWMLQGMTVQIGEDVKNNEDIVAMTAIKNMRGATSERGSYIVQNGIVKAKAVANWFLFDFVNSRPIRIPEELAEVYGTHDFSDDFFTFQKIKPTAAKRIRKVYISNKEIDTNNHLNNRKSAELLMDALPFDFDLGEMNILYKKPAFLNEELYLCKNEIESGFYVHLEDEEGDVRVAAEFKRR